ncbi:hypothetical protein AURDEDRAFT_82731 [Auricularia subglabra TFB-10046 SS5]|nr:hypothetical protein AURDEDRAFT_82731 [Auricularia subglabra TFB-10046 SS5]
MAALSLGSFALRWTIQFVSGAFSSHSIYDRGEPPEPAPSLQRRFSALISSSGGTEFFAWKLARSLGSFALLGLSVASVMSNVNVPSAKQQGDCCRMGYTVCQLNLRYRVDHAFVGLYAYTSLLAIRALTAPVRCVFSIHVHLGVVLVGTWLVFIYRNIWPLATYTLAPLDVDSDALFWHKFIVLTLVAAVVPLLIPNPYVPVDQEISSEPTPEQTASLLSFMLFSFLDPLVWAGYRTAHLAFDKLPPLADYDRAAYLKKISFRHMDPFSGARKRHVFWGLVAVFKRDYLVMSVIISVRVATAILAPVGLNRLLNYIETGGVGATVRPWFWIGWLFWGPLVSGIAMHRYLFMATRTLVRVEAIVTQLVFEHALKIRIPAEVPTDSANQSPGNSASTSISEGDDGVTCASSGDDRDAKPPAPATISDSASTGNRDGAARDLIGRVNNLVTSDVSNITDARDILFLLLYCPLQVVICMSFLYAVLGWSAFAGLAAMIVTFPLPGWIASKVEVISKARMKKTDARVQQVTEAVSLLRMIKLFAWENKVTERLQVKREEELVWVRKGRIMNLINIHLNYWIPLVTMIGTYATYTLVLGGALSASVVFSSMAVFEMLRDQLHITVYTLPAIINAKVSLDRLTDFLNNTELLDRYSQGGDGCTQPGVRTPSIPGDAIGFNDATFLWARPQSPDQRSTSPPTRRRDFRLRIPGTLLFKRGAVNLVVGPTGCGKTALLLALCGELHFEPENPSSWYQLPRGGGVAYAAQEAWVQNETVRDNILFGAVYDEERYKTVLKQCALEHDLSLFEAGDRTLVGEKGLTLSGGQKARITLARAIYSSAEILLLDDVLSALDVHTSKWIVAKCLGGKFAQGRTIILVTHNVRLVADIAQYVVSLGIDGRVIGHKSIDEALVKESILLTDLPRSRDEHGYEEQVVDISMPLDDGRSQFKDNSPGLIVTEELAEGHVGREALNLYLHSLGGIAFWIVFLLGMFGADVFEVLQIYFLGYWASWYERVASPKDVPVLQLLMGYTALLIAASILYSTAYATFVYGAHRASRSIHDRLIDAIFGATFRWLDQVPTSRITARCTQDMRSIDGPLGNLLTDLVTAGVALTCKLAAVIVMSPVFVLPGMIVAAIGWWFGQLYIASQLCVKREVSNARSPVLGHFGAAIAGLVSVRAHGAEEAFKMESMVRIDKYVRAARTFYNLTRWICIRVNALGGLFAAGLAAYLVYGPKTTDASRTGFSLVMAVAFSSTIWWFITVLNSFEVEGNCLERIQQYVVIEQEPKPTEESNPPAYWPTSGDLRVEHLEAKYSPDGPLVLKDVNFELKSGERVGVVGRTGSGKSSLTLALLRCIFTSGHVYYDGIATDTISLDALRSNITIIPQQPELLSGTLRQNLDPFEEYNDATLNGALHAAGLFRLQEESEEDRISLDTPISSGGGNLSQGQRQILALARAIARGNKILILDEATAAVDYATDAAIQASIRRELKDMTIITIAHRLRTVMDADKIMVLDAGHLVEFDTPKNLLKKTPGLLRSLVLESTDKNELFALAGVEREPQVQLG